MPDSPSVALAHVPLPLLALRSVIGGVLMGLANLVPGISGGTMLLAAGIYPRFIAAIAELSTLRFRVPSLVVLGSVALAAVLGILLLAGTVKDLVVDRRWIMYSLFIGLTLGGLPVVWKMARPARSSTWAGAVCGFLAMSALALAQQAGAGASGAGSGSFPMLFFAGLAGASAMILPGVSGGYLLLVLGQYVPILSGIDAFKDALSARDLAAAMGPAIGVLLPVGLGVVAGVVGVSNLLKWLLARYSNATLGVLLGLLLGAVVGLWPFQAGVEPVPGETVIKGQLVTVETLGDVDPEDWPIRYFPPTAGQMGAALGFVLLGIAVTSLISRFGEEKTRPEETP
jgi:putative membrane protein